MSKIEMSEAQKRAKAKYNSSILRVLIEFPKSDAVLAQKLQEQPSKQKYIKELIRKDLNLK